MVKAAGLKALGMVDPVIALRVARVERARRAMHSSFRSFFSAFPPNKPYVYGRHTELLLFELQKTTEMLEAGLCRYLIFNMPPRHGKSDVVSRRYPAWHELRNPDHEFMLASYNYNLATGMAWEVRRLFSEVSPVFGLSIMRGRSDVDAWLIDGHKGGMYSAGIGGTITGRGAHVLAIDDYCKNRMEAESETVRDSTWRSFQSDMMTRLAPIHAVVIVANRWHVDDLVGRIQEVNNPKSDRYDPDFPKFEVIVCDAEPEPGKWLFPERFSPGWYVSMRAMNGGVGGYSWQSQFRQDPRPRTGNMLRADRVKFVELDKVPTGLRWVRGWDVASTSRDLAKDDPDYTVGTLCAWDRKARAIWIKDVVRGQWSAMPREAMMLKCAELDGQNAIVKIEAVGGYKDAYERVRSILSGKAVVRPVTPTADKVARASTLEATFESGNVYIVRGPWTDAWLAEIGSFPSGKKDDQVDSLSVALSDEILSTPFTVER